MSEQVPDTQEPVERIRVCEVPLLKYDAETADRAIRRASRLGYGTLHGNEDSWRRRPLVDVLGSASDVELTRQFRKTHRYREEQK